MISAEVSSPQTSVREKCSSFALCSNQTNACSRLTRGLDSLDTAPLMLALHRGSLYRDDMVLGRKKTTWECKECVTTAFLLPNKSHDENNTWMAGFDIILNLKHILNILLLYFFFWCVPFIVEGCRLSTNWMVRWNVQTWAVWIFATTMKICTCRFAS